MFVSKTKYQELEKQNEKNESKYHESERRAKELEEELRAKEQEVKELEKSLSKLTDDAEENAVKITINDTIETVTPSVRYKRGIEDKLVEGGYIDEFSAKETYAVQLALMTIANDSISAILDSFEGGTKDE